MNHSVLQRISNKITIVPDAKITRYNNAESLVKKIKGLHLQKKLVPVICEDMFEYVNPETNERQSLHSFIVERIIDRYLNDDIEIRLSDNDLRNILNGGYYGMSLLKTKLNSDIYEDIYYAVFNEDNELRDGITIKPYVCDFLKAGQFPLIITTSCYPILENELGDIYRSYWNERQTKNDTELPSMCIYHIFGQAKSHISDWGYNDKQILKFLETALSNDYSLSNLTSKISNPQLRLTLMFIGNDCPDWLFRFMLTPIYGGDLYDDGIGYYFYDEHRYDARLDHFLSDIKFKKEDHMIEIIKSVTQIIKPKVTAPDTSFEQYDFFIAHSSDDNEAVRKLVEQMTGNGLKVWVDYDKIKDGHYWQRIIDAMRNSKYFMPYVTESYLHRVKKGVEVQNAFKDSGIIDLSLDMSECVKLESYLSGVQIELLLANKLIETFRNDRVVFSIPVIQKGSMLYFENITPEKIRNLSNSSRFLPQNLFWGLQMYEFDSNNPSTFSLDWNRYKSVM